MERAWLPSPAPCSRLHRRLGTDAARARWTYGAASFRPAYRCPAQRDSQCAGRRHRPGCGAVGGPAGSDARARAALRGLTSSAVQPFSGHVLTQRVDAHGLYALFADPEPALRAAIDIALRRRRSIGTYRSPAKCCRRTAEAAAVPISLRMAVHTGDVEVVGYRLYRPGATPLWAAARSGPPWTDSYFATTQLQLHQEPAGLELRPLGRHQFPGSGQAEELLQVIAPGLPATFPPLPGAERSLPGNLPAALTSFVGRRREVATVTALFRAHRLVTLTGPGGAGRRAWRYNAHRGYGTTLPMASGWWSWLAAGSAAGALGDRCRAFPAGAPGS